MVCHLRREEGAPVRGGGMNGYILYLQHEQLQDRHSVKGHISRPASVVCMGGCVARICVRVQDV